jgi:hypothetical protein
VTILSLLITVIGAVVLLQGSTFHWFGNQQGYLRYSRFSSHKVMLETIRSPAFTAIRGREVKVAGIPAALFA